MKKHLLFLVIFVGFTTIFAQKPYNIVMNIHGDPTTQMAFNWLTKAGIKGGKVEIILDDIVVNTVPAKSTSYSDYTVNKAVVKGLLPNTKYSFRVGNNKAWSDVGTFTTAKLDKVPFTFLYTTDQQPEYEWQYAVLQTNNRAAFSENDVDFWMDCGDLVYEGRDQNQWNILFNAQQDQFLKTPFAPVQGNHDARSKTKFRHHFNTEKFGMTDPAGSTYTYIFGDAQFFAINGEKWNNPMYISKVKKWMRTQIKAHPNIKWRFVYFHKSIYSGTIAEQNRKSCAVWFKAMSPVFDELNIDLVFQGHSHVYDVIGPVKNTLMPPESVSNVFQNNDSIAFPKNVNGKSGGIFNVKEGTLYFTNGTFGTLFFEPTLLDVMPGKYFTHIPHYASLITGYFGQPENSTYSRITVSSENITITTFEIVNGSSRLLDEIKVVK